MSAARKPDLTEARRAAERAIKRPVRLACDDVDDAAKSPARDLQRRLAANVEETETPEPSERHQRYRFALKFVGVVSVTWLVGYILYATL